MLSCRHRAATVGPLPHCVLTAVTTLTAFPGRPMARPLLLLGNFCGQVLGDWATFDGPLAQRIHVRFQWVDGQWATWASFYERGSNLYGDGSHPYRVWRSSPPLEHLFHGSLHPPHVGPLAGAPAVRVGRWQAVGLGTSPHPGRAHRHPPRTRRKPCRSPSGNLPNLPNSM